MVEKCPFCKEWNLVSIMVHDDITNGTKTIGKSCLLCQSPIKKTKYLTERRERIIRKLRRRKKPTFRKQKPCPRCKRYNIQYKPIPYTGDGLPRRWGKCLHCRNPVEKWTETDDSRIKVKKLIFE